MSMTSRDAGDSKSKLRSGRKSSPLTRAKDAVSIADLWPFYGLPGHPSTSGRSPLRHDEKPSFSVFADGRLWNDFATGEHGDVIDFVAKVEGLSKSDAAKRLIALHRGELARGGGCDAVARGEATDDCSAADVREEKERKRASWPPFREMSDAERRQLADLRQLDIGAIDMTSRMGLLVAMDTSTEGPAWALTDKLRVNAQARRLDGQPWQRLPGQPKAWTLPGSEASWPIGLADVDPLDDVLLVEGGPDLLAAHQLVIEANAVDGVAPVAMLGASLRMAERTLEKFRHRRVILCPHLDANGHGLEAAKRWAIQLRPLAMSMSWIDLAGLRRTDGSSVKDLCDLMSRGPGGHEVNADAIAGFARMLAGGGVA